MGQGQVNAARPREFDCQRPGDVRQRRLNRRRTGGGGGDGGVGGTVWTNMVQATGTGRLASKSAAKDVYYPGSPNGIIDPAGPLKTQANINGWVVDALEQLEAVVGTGTGSSVEVGDDAPDTPDVGDLWFCSLDTELTLYIFDGTVWVPAAPPVSLDGIDSRVSYLEPLVESQQQAVGQLRGVTVEQQKKLSQLETELDGKLDKSGGKMVGKLICDRIGQNEEGFVIKGLKVNLEEGNLLQTYHNGGDTPDAVNYFGRMDSPSNIVNKAYVDEKTKAPTEMYDGEFTFVAEAPTTKRGSAP